MIRRATAEDLHQRVWNSIPEMQACYFPTLVQVHLKDQAGCILVSVEQDEGFLFAYFHDADGGLALYNRQVSGSAMSSLVLHLKKGEWSWVSLSAAAKVPARDDIDLLIYPEDLA